jgi:hypothetical protein
MADWLVVEGVDGDGDDVVAADDARLGETVLRTASSASERMSRIVRVMGAHVTEVSTEIAASRVSTQTDRSPRPKRHVRERLPARRCPTASLPCVPAGDAPDMADFAVGKSVSSRHTGAEDHLPPGQTRPPEKEVGVASCASPPPTRHPQ